jgi:hypothetical protein
MNLAEKATIVDCRQKIVVDNTQHTFRTET